MTRQILLLLTAFALCGCVAARPSPISDDVSTATKQLERIAPVGTAEGEAVVALKGIGFSVDYAHGAWGAENFPEYLSCYYRDSGSIVFRSWRVAIVIVNAKASGYRVVTGLTGP
jgi:hypothetical protein